MNAHTVLEFWFKKYGEKEWWQKNVKFDALIRTKFLKTYHAIVLGECASWRASAEGRLAEVIVLDQFARNMFRGKAQAFVYDPLALALAQEAVNVGADKSVSSREQQFFYMPFMHSESKKVQRESIALFKKLGNPEILKFALDHQNIVEKFGRFPHRNAARGLKSTAAEKAFMKTHKGF